MYVCVFHFRSLMYVRLIHSGISSLWIVYSSGLSILGKGGGYAIMTGCGVGTWAVSFITFLLTSLLLILCRLVLFFSINLFQYVLLATCIFAPNSLGGV